MKKRQIILDFTSLLDVIMIILFFFIIFSNLETDNLKKDLEDKQQQVSAELEEAKAKNEDVIVAIAADKAVEYDYVNQALQAAREAGISKIGFVTETKAQ